MANNNNNMEEEEQYNQAFGEHTDIPEDCREYINDIKNNNPDVNDIVIRSSDADEFTNLAWKLLGRYIANNTHLKKLVLEYCHLTDETMAILFRALKSSVSLKWLDLDNNDFGINGVRCMIPFLQNSPNLSILYLGGSNNNVNNECLEVLVSALNEKAVTELYFYNSSITDISALGRYNLPNLEYLGLSGNNIGRDGIITLSNLLQQDDTRLTALELDNTGIDDEGAELLATSLEHNTKLEILRLRGNSNITEKGHRAILNRLNDISSIESTYASNHTLTELNLYYYHSTNETIGHINSAIEINKNNPSSRHAAGRTKVIKYQLNSQKREELCRLQGVEYSSIGNLFVDIEPKLLPSILVLIGNEHGQSELYTALVQTAPELLSYIDRRALIDGEFAKVEVRCADLKDEYERKIAALKTEMLIETSRLNDKKGDLSSRLALIDLGDMKQSVVGEEGNGVAESSKKRQRS